MNPFLVPITLFIVGGFVMVGLPIARALARRLDRQGSMPSQLGSDTSARLERMEQAIESIAVEVERISEGQRFTTRLLTERAPDRVGDRAGALPVTSTPERQ